MDVFNAFLGFLCKICGCKFELYFAGFVEFGPEIAGSDQKTKLLLSSEDLVCAYLSVFVLSICLLVNTSVCCLGCTRTV